MNQTGSLFSELGIGAKILEILGQKFTIPTPIQAQVIPQALTGRDIIGIAQTGTGKTLAFGIPMLEQLSKNGGQAIILLPTRELALQVEEVLKPLARAFRLETVVLIGGAAIRPQVQQLRRRPAIIVATPGRLADHMHQRNVTLNEVKIVVLDEADRMLDIGFLPQIKEILAAAPKARQTLLFSATMPTAIAAIAKNYMDNPARVEVAPAGTSATNVEQAVIMTRREDKIRLLEKLLKDHEGTVLVFSRTKHGARKIAHATNNLGHTAAEIHSDRSLAQRKDALAGFKNGKYRVLVATDIASRGIDVKEISLVINYDLPDNIDDYVHRIGRTGRAGAFGRALSFAGHDERYAITQIERLIRKKLTILDVPVSTLPPQQASVQQAMSRVYPDSDLRSARTHSAPRPSSRPSYSDRGERPSRFDRNDRPSRSSNFDRSDRGDRSERPQRSSYSDRSARPSYSDRPARTGDRPSYSARPTERTSYTARPERADRFARSERVEKFSRPERAEGFSRSDRPVRTSSFDRAARPERAERPSYSDRPSRFDRSERPQRDARPSTGNRFGDRKPFARAERPTRAPLQRHERSSKPADKKFVDMPLKKASGKPARKFDARPNRVKPKFAGSSKSRFKR